jgi:hypothetical protein
MRIISRVISEEQSAFISGRQILDCLLVANETVDDIRKKKKKAAFLFKVDFEKAYDSVSGSYLSCVMPSMLVWVSKKLGGTGSGNV